MQGGSPRAYQSALRTIDTQQTIQQVIPSVAQQQQVIDLQIALITPPQVPPTRQMLIKLTKRGACTFEPSPQTYPHLPDSTSSSAESGMPLRNIISLGGACSLVVILLLISYIVRKITVDRQR